MVELEGSSTYKVWRSSDGKELEICHAVHPLCCSAALESRNVFLLILTRGYLHHAECCLRRGVVIIRFL